MIQISNFLRGKFEIYFEKTECLRTENMLYSCFFKCVRFCMDFIFSTPLIKARDFRVFTIIIFILKIRKIFAIFLISRALKLKQAVMEISCWSSEKGHFIQLFQTTISLIFSASNVCHSETGSNHKMAFKKTTNPRSMTVFNFSSPYQCWSSLCPRTSSRNNN